jgi:two-component system phosphate regulon sensor histidine kinase PhoR
MRAPVVSWRLFGTVFGVVLPVTLLIMGGGAVFVQQSPAVQLLCLVGLVLVTGALCIWLTRVALEPITLITEVAGRIARGELATRAPTGSRGALGELGQALNAMADQLERRLQEQASQRSQAQAILESMGEGVLALDADGRILWLNGSAQRLLGTDAERAAGKRLTELFRQPDVEELVRETATHQRPAAREVHAFSPDERVVRMQSTPCAGGPSGAAMVVVVQDVTEIRRLERMRREFVANVSHELKTPLTAIKGLLETLLSGALEDAANNRRFVTLIDEDATRLGRLIDDLLALSQIESKAAALALQPVPLRPLLEDVVRTLRPLADARQVTLHLEVAADAQPVQGDPDRLRQIFSNLLDNAVKFNKPGGRVAVRTTAEGPTLRVAVEDTGAGIPEADLPRIFERFYRVDKARSRELGGTGLGLAIVKHLVELHQGRVMVESRPGQGSTFTVTLPLAPLPAPR